MSAVDDRVLNMAEQLIGEAAAQCRRKPNHANTLAKLNELYVLESDGNGLSQWMEDAYMEAKIMLREMAPFRQSTA